MTVKTTGKLTLSTSKFPLLSHSTRPTTTRAAAKISSAMVSSTSQATYTTHGGPQCPSTIPRSVYYIVFGHNCYEFILRVHKTWPDAERDCKSKGGHLVTISSMSEQNFIYTSVQVRQPTKFEHPTNAKDTLNAST